MTTPAATAGQAPSRRRAALAHQRRACRRLWALRLLEDIAGNLIVCRYCDAVRGPRVVTAAPLSTAERA